MPARRRRRARVVARRRRARVGQEPPRPRVRRGGRAARAPSSSTAPATRSSARPYGPFVEALDQLARATDPDELRAELGAGGGELTRLLPDLAAARRRRSPPPVDGRPGHGAPPAAHRGHRSARRRQRARARRCWSSRTPTGPTRRRCCSCATSPARRGTRGCSSSRRSATPRPTSRRRSSEALADLRRSEAWSACGSPGSPARRSTEFVRARRRRRARAEPRELARALRELTGGNAFLVTELWRTLVETGRRRARRAGRPAHATLADLGTPESVREVVEPAPRAPGARRPPTCSSSRPIAGAGVRARRRPPRRVADAELLEPSTRRSRSGMIEEAAVATARLPLHPRARAPGALRPAHRRCGGPSCTCAWARRSSAAGGRSAARSPISPTTSPPRRRSTGPSARSSTTCSPPRAATGALAFDEAAARLRDGARARRSTSPRARAEMQLELGTRATARARRSTRCEAFRAAADLARELGRRRAARARRDRLRGGLLAPGDRRPGRDRAARGGGRTRSASDDSALRVRLLGGLARALDFRGDHERGAVVRDEREAMARRCDDRARSRRRSSSAPTGRRRRRSLAEILDDAHRGARLGEELGDTEIRAEAMAWRVPGFVALGDLDAAPARGHRAARAPPSRPRSRSCCTSPSTTPRRSRCATGASRTPRRAARRSHEWSRLLTGRDAVGHLRHPDVRHPPRAGPPRRARAVVRCSPASAARAGPWRPGLVALLAELGHGGRGAARARARSRATGSSRSRASLWLASLDLPDRRVRGARRRADRRARLPGARAARRRGT